MMFNIYYYIRKNKGFFSFIFVYILIFSIILYSKIYIYLTVPFEEKIGLFMFDYFHPFWSNIIDSFFILVVSLPISLFRINRALRISSIISLLWTLANVIYSRFFNGFLFFEVLDQTASLPLQFFLQYWKDAFVLLDIFPIICTIIVFFLTRKNDKKKKLTYSLMFIVCLLFAVIVDMAVDIGYRCIKRQPIWVQGLYKIDIIKNNISLRPNYVIMQLGYVRGIILPYVFKDEEIYLTNEEKQWICNSLEEKNYTMCFDSKENTQSNKNLIFIIVESYLSYTSDLLLNGKEVTPFLNRIKRQNGNYYNGLMTPNITTGESSDGQFIYLTGLLPIRGNLTINVVANKRIPSLVTLLELNDNSRMITATPPSFWKKDKMCYKYGINQLISSFDISGSNKVEDDELLEHACLYDLKSETPFFSVVLTMSMHSPYDKKYDDISFELEDSSMSQEFLNYLSACHFMDRQIEHYFNLLKEYGVYDNSVIVIASDHQAHSNMLNQSSDIIGTNIPVYIVNASIDNDSVYHGPINQVDLFPTILELFGVNSKWKGVGQSFLHADYKFSVSEDTYKLSDLLIQSNYFETVDPSILER